MICEHLRALEQAILARGIRETFRGKAWSQNCREWVYFDCFIDTAAVHFQSRFRTALSSTHIEARMMVRRKATSLCEARRSLQLEGLTWSTLRKR